MKQTVKNILTPAFWRSFAALLCVLLATSFMNTTVFPLFDNIWTGAREFAIFMGFLAFLTFGLISLLKPQVMASKATDTMGLGAILIAAMLLPFAFAFGSLPLLIIAICCSALGRSWSTLLTGMAMARLTQAQAGICITLALICDDLISVAAWYVPVAVSLVLFIALPTISLLLSAGPARPFFIAAAKAEPPLDLAVTQPNTFLPLGSAVFVCLFLFRLVFGFTLRFGEVSGTPLMDSWAVIAICIFALYMLVSRKSLPADTLICWSTLLVIAGFYIVATGWGNTAIIGVTVLSAGSELTNLIAWMLLVSIARRNVYGAVAAFAWGHCIMSLGSITGAQLALSINNSIFGNEGVTIMSGIVIVGFAAYALFVLRKVSFNEIIQGLTAAVVENPAANIAPQTSDATEHEEEAPTNADAAELPNVSVQTATEDMPCADGGTEGEAATEQAMGAAAQQEPAPRPATLEERCAAIGDAHGLTKREREVLGMLARGRNRAYIEENLVISRNTVNAHVKHIYNKLDIHSHQDLLDMVEVAE